MKTIPTSMQCYMTKTILEYPLKQIQIWQLHSSRSLLSMKYPQNGVMPLRLQRYESSDSMNCYALYNISHYSFIEMAVLFQEWNCCVVWRMHELINMHVKIGCSFSARWHTSNLIVQFSLLVSGCVHPFLLHLCFHRCIHLTPCHVRCD